jgi:hypothetical protein
LIDLIHPFVPKNLCNEHRHQQHSNNRAISTTNYNDREMATMSSSSASSTLEADTKISNDLVVLKEKMDLLETMIDPPDASSPRLSVKTDEAVRSVAGYLDACGPRMIELVTACSAREGVVSEAVFGEVLAQNDRLQNLLTDFDARLLAETSASASVAAPSSAAEAAASTAASDLLTEQFGDLLLGNEDPFAEAHGSTNKAGAKTTGETSEDFDDTFFAAAPGLAPPASASPAPSAPASALPAPKDPFDDFFAERTDQH